MNAHSAENDAWEWQGIRPHYPQRHPAMAAARNIVNQVLDEAGTDVATRQRINDDCDQFVAWMVERYASESRVIPPEVGS